MYKDDNSHIWFTQRSVPSHAYFTQWADNKSTHAVQILKFEIFQTHFPRQRKMIMVILFICHVRFPSSP